MCCVPINQHPKPVEVEFWHKCSDSSQSNFVEMVKCVFCNKDLRKIDSYFGLSEDDKVCHACRVCADKQKDIMKQNSDKGLKHGKEGLPPQSTDKHYLAAYGVGQKQYAIDERAKRFKRF